MPEYRRVSQSMTRPTWRVTIESLPGHMLDVVVERRYSLATRRDPDQPWEVKGRSTIHRKEYPAFMERLRNRPGVRGLLVRRVVKEEAVTADGQV
jgi:hypothetical protein